MFQTLRSWIFFQLLCSKSIVLSNSSWSSLEWKRMNISYFRHIAFSSGVKSFSNGFGYNKFLSSMKSFLRFLSSSLQQLSNKKFLQSIHPDFDALMFQFVLQIPIGYSRMHHQFVSIKYQSIWSTKAFVMIMIYNSLFDNV